MQEKEGIAKLVSRIQILDQIKSDEEYPKDIRTKAADNSAMLYDELLRLCDGDTHLVASLLGQKEWFDTSRKKKLP